MTFQAPLVFIFYCLLLLWGMWIHPMGKQCMYLVFSDTATLCLLWNPMAAMLVNTFSLCFLSVFVSLSNPFIPLNCIVYISILFILKALIISTSLQISLWAVLAEESGQGAYKCHLSCFRNGSWRVQVTAAVKELQGSVMKGEGLWFAVVNISFPSKFSLKVYTKTVRDGQTQIDVHFYCLQVAYEIVVFMDVTISWSKCGMFSAGCCSFRWYYHKALANWSSWKLREILLLQRVFIQGHVSLYESPLLLFCWAVMTHYDACEMEPLKIFLCLCIHFFSFSIILTTKECYHWKYFSNALLS